MVFYEESPLSIRRLIHAIFKARFMISKSIIFKPSRFFSAVIFVLIFGGFAFPNKTKNNGLETFKAQMLYTSLARPSAAFDDAYLAN